MKEQRSQAGSRRTLIAFALVLATVYIAWAIPFMLESSVVAIDGRRYYGLFDDAMISMRYAWNLSHGQGLVWNPGERIEGFHLAGACERGRDAAPQVSCRCWSGTWHGTARRGPRCR